MGRPGINGDPRATGRRRREHRLSRRLRRSFPQDLRRMYAELSDALPSDRMLFLNPGCVDSRRNYARLRKADRADRYHFALVRRALDGVELQGCDVLEIGSGRGGNCRYLVRYTDARRVIGLDTDKANVQFCRRVHSYRNVSFFCGEAERLPLRDAAVDVVLSIASAHCCEDLNALLGEARRVLKPRGILCLADAWSFEPLGLDWTARRRALERSGFRVLSKHDLSEPVFQAVQRNDGLPQRLRALATPATRKLLNRIADSMELVGLHLATAQCSYILWRFQKP